MKHENWAQFLFDTMMGKTHYDHKWKLTHNFKEIILEGNINDLKCKALSLEILKIDTEMKYVTIRIKIEDQNKNGITYVDCKDGLYLGDTLTLLDLNHSMEITIT